MVPVAPDRTEVEIYPVLLQNVPKAIDAARLRVHEHFYGPGGFGAPDDLEMFERNQVELATDEVNQRGFGRRWRQPMVAGARA